MAKFLYHSAWGKASSGWSLREELTRFEQLMYRPVIRYTLNCGGSTADTMTVAIQTISYLCSGNKHGAQAVKPQHEFNLKIDPTTRAIKVEV
ncbi:hypothetical protein P4S72_06425 [Vibrio sp. PP-XX7]